MRRYCRTFFCDHVGDRICCVNCRWRKDCTSPCLNHPVRCGLEDTERSAAEQPDGSVRDPL